MDELYQVVQIRINTARTLHCSLISTNETVSATDLRKLREDERLRVEKENWILSVFRTLKTFTPEQKQALFWRSIAMMVLIWPDFRSVVCDESALTSPEEMTRRFLERFVRLFADFFLPLESAYDFRISVRSIVKPSSQTVIPDLLKYLIEFSRDYFKNFLVFLSSKLNLNVPNNRENSTVLQNSVLFASNNYNIGSTAVNLEKYSSKDFLSQNLNMNNQQNQASNLLDLGSSSISNGSFPTNNEILCVSSLFSNEKLRKEVIEGWKQRSKSYCTQLTEQSTVNLSDKSQLEGYYYQADKNNNNKGNSLSLKRYDSNERPSPSPMRVSNKPKPPAPFPSSINLQWYSSQDAKGMQNNTGIKSVQNLYEVILDCESIYGSLGMEGKIRRAKGDLNDLRALSEQILESCKIRNSFVQATLSNYFDKFKSKYPAKILQYQNQQLNYADKVNRGLINPYYKGLIESNVSLITPQQESTLLSQKPSKSSIIPNSTLATSNLTPNQSQLTQQPFSSKGPSPLRNNGLFQSQFKILKISNTRPPPPPLLLPPKQVQLFAFNEVPIPSQKDESNSNSCNHINSFRKMSNASSQNNINSSRRLGNFNNSYASNNSNSNNNYNNNALSKNLSSEPQGNSMYFASEGSRRNIMTPRKKSKERILENVLGFLKNMDPIQNLNRPSRPPSCSSGLAHRKRRGPELPSGWAVVKKDELQDFSQRKIDNQETTNSIKDANWVSLTESSRTGSLGNDCFQGSVFRRVWKKCKGTSDLKQNTLADEEYQGQDKLKIKITETNNGNSSNNNNNNSNNTNPQISSNNNNNDQQMKNNNIKNELIQKSSSRCKGNSVWQQWWAAKRKQEQQQQQQMYSGQQKLDENSQIVKQDTEKDIRPSSRTQQHRVISHTQTHSHSQLQHSLGILPQNNQYNYQNISTNNNNINNNYNSNITMISQTNPSDMPSNFYINQQQNELFPQFSSSKYIKTETSSQKKDDCPRGVAPAKVNTIPVYIKKLKSKQQGNFGTILMKQRERGIITAKPSFTQDQQNNSNNVPQTQGLLSFHQRQPDKSEVVLLSHLQ